MRKLLKLVIVLTVLLVKPSLLFADLSIPLLPSSDYIAVSNVQKINDTRHNVTLVCKKTFNPEESYGSDTQLIIFIYNKRGVLEDTASFAVEHCGFIGELMKYPYYHKTPEQKVILKIVKNQ